MLYAKTSGLVPTRIDLPQDQLHSFLKPMVAQMIQDAAKIGAPPLYETGVPPGILDLFKQTVGEVLTGVTTPGAAAQKMQDAYEEARKG